jgi:hypothetical protein
MPAPPAGFLLARRHLGEGHCRLIRLVRRPADFNAIGRDITDMHASTVIRTAHRLILTRPGTAPAHQFLGLWGAISRRAEPCNEAILKTGLRGPTASPN